VDKGEALLLLNYLHQPADTSYKASHAILLGNGLRVRIGPWTRSGRAAPISPRAFDASGDMVDADLAAEGNLKPSSERADPEAAYIHAHYAKRGCYAARIDRA
jgi:Protein of unknown function (DUF1203)